MKEARFKLLYIVFFLCICLIGYSFAEGDTSKEKFAWGFGRGKEHSQAVLDKKPYEALKEYERNCFG